MANLMSMYTKLVAEVDQYNRDMDGARKHTGLVTDAMKTMSTIAAGVVVAGIGAVSAAITVAVGKTADWGENLDSISDVLGTTSEQSAGLAVMVNEVGGSTEQLTGAMQIMTRGLQTAKGELGPSGVALQKLGISAMDAAGNIKPATDLFQEVANKLGPMTDGLDKSSLEMDIFGRSGAQMGDILAAAANGGMDAYIKKAKDFGLALTPEQTQATIDFGRAQKDLDMILQGFSVTIGTAVLPAITNLVKALQEKLADAALQQKIKDLADRLSKFAEDSAPKLLDLAVGVLNLIDGLSRVPEPVYKIVGVLGLVLLAVNPVLSTLKGAATILGSLAGAFGVSSAAGSSMATVLAFLTGPAGLLALALVALVVTILLFGKQAYQTMSDISAIFRKVVGDIIQNNINAFVGAINGIIHAIQAVITWVGNLGAAFARLTIPAWLTPGSPTPLEIGVKGISDAMKQASDQVLPTFQAQLNLSAKNPVPAAQPVIQPQQSTEIDYARLGRAFRDALLTSGMAA